MNPNPEARVILVNTLKLANEAVSIALSALADFDALPENNVFSSLKEASSLRDTLYQRAFDDCEGAGNCGCEEYSQQCLIAGELYEATLSVEYNRHDRQYYYIDSSTFELLKVNP